MKKIQILLLAVFAVGALSAYAASSAFAAHEWLELSGTAVTKTVGALIDGLVLLHHKPPALLGGGEILVHCTGQFHGVVGPGGKDEITSVLGLKGETNSTGVHCEVLSSSNSICPSGSLVTVKAEKLPWPTLLILNGTTEEDELTKEPGYATTCKSITVKCERNEVSKLVGNATDGAEFEFYAAGKASCSDGGEGTVLGKGTVLSFFAS